MKEKSHEKTTNRKFKLPGMLYIMISFIPWIVYWVITDTENKFGIILSLGIVSVLVIAQIPKKSFFIMDIVTLLYFIVAVIGTYALNLEIFYEKTGLMGYSTLFLMCILSMAIKRPYTLSVSKRDYPESYWNNEYFIKVNYYITFMWALIYLVNALIYLLMRYPYTVIITNVFIVVGMIASLYLPKVLPSFFSLSRFNKYDWKVNVNKSSHKSESEYDVIIVGSGLGGLSCGALLSKYGYKVLILEQHSLVGGYSTSFERKGFKFNSGVENISGLWDNGVVLHLIERLDIDKNEFFSKNSLRVMYKNNQIDFGSNVDETIKIFSKIFPEEETNLINFFDDAMKAYKKCYGDLHEFGAPLNAPLIAKVRGEKKLMDFPKEFPHFSDWMNKTFEQKLSEFIQNEDLKSLLTALISYLGTKVDNTKASDALTACVSYYIHGGGYFPKGGAQKFSDKLAGIIRYNNGKVLTKSKVNKILIDKNRVTGVKCGNDVYKSSVVVSNSNAKTTFLNLIDNKHLNKKYRKFIDGLKMSISCFMLFLGVDKDLNNLPVLIKDIDNRYEITVNSNADENLSPPNQSSLTLIMPGAYNDFPERGTDDYKRKKHEYEEILISRAERVLPDIRKHIVVRDSSSPKTFERYTSMPEGAIYAFDQSIGNDRPLFKSPIKGLYLVGASTFPGGGVEAVIISGIICFNDINGWVRC